MLFSPFNSPNEQCRPAHENLDLSSDSTSLLSNGASGLDLLPKIKKNALAEPLVITVNSATTNATFQANLCDSLAAAVDTTNVQVKSSGAAPTSYFVIPGCFKSYTNVTTVSGMYWLIESFASFPPTIITFSLSYSKVAYTSSSSPTSATPSDASSGSSGINADGTIDWDGVFARFPVVGSFYLTNSNLAGSLPTVIPSWISTFSVAYNLLNGSIPPTIFNNISAQFLYIYLNNNQLTGGLPETLFQPLAGRPISSLYFYFQSNKLSGALPANLLAPLATAFTSSLTLQLDHNSFSGPIPSSFIASGLLTAYTRYVSILLSSNGLSGPWPTNLLQNVSKFGLFSLDLSSNSLSGTLPAQLFPNSWSTTSGTLTINLFNNSLSGSISPILFTGGLTANSTVIGMNLRLDHNSLIGSLPESLFYNDGSSKRDSDSDYEDGYESLHTRGTSASGFALTTTASFVLNLEANQLTGTIPATFLNAAFASSVTSISVSLSDNMLSGTIPDSLWSIPATASLSFSVAYTNVDGPLPAFCQANTYYNFSNSGLSGALPDAWQSCRFSSLFLDNTAINGSINPTLMTKIGSLSAANTALTGILPPVSITMASLILSGTMIDFCNASSASNTNAILLSSCSFANTTACDCRSNFLAKCVSLCPAPPLAPLSCSGTQPTGFSCVGGIWTAPNITSPSLTIPSGAGTVLVAGNISSSSIVFQDTGSTVEIGGCAANLTHVTIVLTTTQLESLDPATLHTLITLNNTSSCTDLSSLSISATVSDSKCKRIKAQTAIGNGSTTFGAYFTMDNSKCRTWWIILVSVICGVILIAVIALALLSIFSPAFRAKIRPFSSRRGPTGDNLK